MPILFLFSRKHDHCKKDLIKCLKRKFGFEERGESDHDALTLYIGGKRVATTRFSRSLRRKSTIPDTLLRLMARQLWVNMRQFRDMYNCPMSKEDYLAEIKRKGKIE